ncbi:MAG TPA: T9SS type A sorting domain-containing protein [Saprospiraceae bacterium]|nr:T9SS type A sorting domain-containing protein [Saprospiraceae bacterium]
MTKYNPNPTANEINLSFDINAEMSISISLNDIMGRTVQDFSLNQTKFNGNNNLNLQLLPSLLDGIYILNIHTSKGLFTRKIYVISEN